jgi:hypothetical protein
MTQDDTQGRGPADQASRTFEERREAKRLARQNRKAERKMQRRAEKVRAPVEEEQPRRPSVPPAPSSSAVGPLARRVGRIGGNMVLKQIMRMLLGAVLRR